MRCALSLHCAVYPLLMVKTPESIYWSREHGPGRTCRKLKPPPPERCRLPKRRGHPFLWRAPTGYCARRWAAPSLTPRKFSTATQHASTLDRREIATRSLALPTIWLAFTFCKAAWNKLRRCTGRPLAFLSRRETSMERSEEHTSELQSLRH